jgi:hypothetical protein
MEGPSGDEPPRRVIGRILSVGFPLPGVRVDNYTLFSAPSFFDYDALVIDPASIARTIDGALAGDADAKTFTGATVVVTPRSPEDVTVAEILARRRDETARLLERGGVIVCFAHPPPRGDTAGARDGYAWLPARDAVAPQIVAGEGSQVHVVDYQHPLAAFVLGQSANIAYRAHFGARGAEGVRVFARSHGGAAVGFEAPLPAGRLIFVPALRAVPAGDARYVMSDALQAGVRRALGVMAEGRAPAWVEKRTLAGLDERSRALGDARNQLQEAQTALQQAEAAHEELARFRRLLWQEGALGIEDVVLDALRLIGFDVYASDPAELQVRSGAITALIEIEASERPVDVAPHYRLRQRIERAIERRPGDVPRGILFVNGRRLEAPERRDRQVTDALRTAAETMRYCLAPTSGLFEAVAAHLAGDADAVSAYRNALITSDGLLT